MFERCDNCGKRIFGAAYRDRSGVFCSRNCQSFARQPYFCRRCAAETTDESAGGASSVNGVGTMLYGSGSRCPECNSIIQTKYFCIIYIPVVPLGTYRVLYASSDRFLSRKMRPGGPRDDDEYDDREGGRGRAGRPRRAYEADERDDDAGDAPARGRRPRGRRRGCPECGSPGPPVRRSRVSPAGWVLFALLLPVCLFWVGLLVREGYRECPDCGYQDR